ncbi:bola-like protein, partial [Trametopsis cervina]
RGFAAAQSGLSEGERDIYAKLTDRFSPSELAVQDVSGGCGTFYAISIASEAFKDLSTVKQHRLVNEVLKKEIEGIHGLQV